ncbi:two-component system response regulator RegA [Natronospira proteinivora]|uniref:Two-component system response regulator RegA n=1 Tax=Natronospira proteinivora TaxID=1807133 RepID=A0ABT1GAP1_9GAMM|nr:response regulator [Natronospira proteinivora]MCP1728341.1 two-component system response regulator RegA [Natronospira proteinivora]
MTESRTLLIIDDDDRFRRILARALTQRGFTAHTATDGQAALHALASLSPWGMIVDLRLAEYEDGLQLIPRLRKRCPHTRILMLTGYASIATAVEAVKLGADQYLAKPADTETILLHLEGTSITPEPDEVDKAMSVRQLEWEHIQRVLRDKNGNISAAARALGMHRRTLQRKLQKHNTGL